MRITTCGTLGAPPKMHSITSGVTRCCYPSLGFNPFATWSLVLVNPHLGLRFPDDQIIYPRTTMMEF